MDNSLDFRHLLVSKNQTGPVVQNLDTFQCYKALKKLIPVLISDNHCTHFHRKMVEMGKLAVKLRRCNWPLDKLKKNVFVSYLNQIFDPNSWNPNQTLWGNQLNRLRNSSKCLNLIKRDQIDIEHGRKRFKKVKIYWLL